MDQNEKMKKLFRIACSFDKLMQEGEYLAGQGFTHYECLKCDQTKVWENTNHPHICPECTEEIRAEFLKEKK